MNRVTCEVCGDKVPHTSYQMAKHKAEDLEKQLEILAERCAKAEARMDVAEGALRTYADGEKAAVARAEKAVAERDEARRLRAEAEEACNRVWTERDDLRAEVERLKGPASITIPAGSITPEEVAKLSQQGRVMKFYCERARQEGDKAEPTDVASEHERKDRP